MRNEKGFDVLGVGNPLLDHMLHVSQEYLDSLPGEKYGMETVSYDQMIHIIENSGTVPKLVAGGSCANAMKGLAALGRNCAITGKVGTDPSGETVLKDLRDAGVAPLLYYSNTPTAHVTCLITPDGKRTCRTYLGAAAELLPSDLTPQHFDQTRLVHIEGYSLLYPGLTQRAMELAKEHNALVSFDMGSFEIVRKEKTLIEALLSEYVDIAFANEDEVFALTGKHSSDGCRAMQERSPVAIVMMGKKGCVVGGPDGLKKCPAYPIDPIDTTGAGDLFAGGFLHGYLSGKNLEECARWGAITAREVVQVVGAEIPKEKWPAILDFLKSERPGQ